MICLWGRSEWVRNPETGVDAFREIWGKLATHYRGYPSRLVFELLNEPGALIVSKGKTQGLSELEAMKFLNAAIPTIRKTNPNRLLAIGGPGFNNGKDLEAFVTPTNLTYRLPDGSGFAEDENIIGCFHLYEPKPFTHWTKPLRQIPKWKKDVTQQMDHVAAWSHKWKKPVLLSEWGAWKPPKHTVADYKTYLTFVSRQCRARRIPTIFYCAGYNADWSFNILGADGKLNETAINAIIRDSDASEPTKR